MNPLEPLSDAELRRLEETERSLASRVEELAADHTGLRDLDLWLELIALRLRIAVGRLEALLDGGAGGSGNGDETIRAKALAAMNDLEELRLLNLSEDQKGTLQESEAYAEVRELLERFVAAGGGALLDQRERDEHQIRRVARAMVESLRKFVAPEDRYEQVFKSERLPPLLRRIVGFFWPVLAREHQQDPPYGIEEGDEVLLRSERMKMPMSQAIYYLEHELLPRIERELEQSPADLLLQRRRQIVEDKIREYRSVRFYPRATPLNLERGFYTDWLSHYTADGELLVTVDVPVEMMSGTNLDRLREYVQTELVRRLAGKGVSRELDSDYAFRKSLASGRRGSSRLPGSKLDYARGFGALRREFPVVQRLEDRRQLRQLVELVRTNSARKAQRLLEDEARGDRHRGPGGGSLGPPAQQAPS